MVRHVLKAELRRCKRSTLSFAVAGLLASTPGCSGSDAPAPQAEPVDETTHPVIEAYAALESADRGALPSLIDRLDAAFEARPDQRRVAFYAGVMRLWRSVDNDGPPADGLGDVLGAIDKLEQARALGQDDPHVNAFLGITKTVLGATIGDQERIDQGRRLLRESVGSYPSYVNGVMAQALGVLPADHAYYPEALQAAEASLSACGPNVVTAAESSVTYPREGSNPPGACWNEGVVKHVWEGIFLIYGDLAAKAGDRERAKRFYGAAKLSPTYDLWPYAPELEARLDSAGERTALYQDSDATNDPLIWVQERHLCVGCHAQRR